MSGVDVVLMVVKDDLIKQLVELFVSLVGSSVDTDARVLVGNTGENACLESNSCVTTLILVLLPNFFGQALFASGFSVRQEELVEVHQLFSVGVAVVELPFLG